MVGAIDASVKERRTRRTHSKVRTGCITCKIRKKKCDETRPACRRCVDTGRSCDGYAFQLVSTPSTVTTTIHKHLDDYEVDKRSSRCLISSNSRTAINIAMNLEIPRSISKSFFTNQVDGQCFDYFKTMTGPQFDSYFDDSLFGNFAIKASICEPVVLKAAAAVGAVHRRFNLGITREAFEYCAISSRLQKEALELYSKLCRTTSPDFQSHEIHMVTAMLLSMFEAFQGDHDQAVRYMTQGLESLWKRPNTVLYSESTYGESNNESNKLLQLFSKLAACATGLFGRPPRVLASFLNHSLPPMPPKFSSLQEGLDLLFTELDCILHSPIDLWFNFKARAESQQLHVSRILQWNAAYANTLKDMRTPNNIQIRSCRLLKLTKSATYLLLYLVLFMQDDQVHAEPMTTILSQLDLIINQTSTTSASLSATNTSKDIFATSPLLQYLISSHEDLTTNLSRLCILSDSFLDETSRFNYISHTISLDSGIGPPRLARPGPDSSAKTRHLIRSLLPAKLDTLYDDHQDMDSKSSSSSSLFSCTSDLAHPLGAYTIAEHLSSIEEHAVLIAAKHLIEPHLPSLSLLNNGNNNNNNDTVSDSIKWIDATCFLEEGKVLVRHCRRVGDLASNHADTEKMGIKESENSGFELDGGGGGGDRRKDGLIWTQTWLKFDR